MQLLYLMQFTFVPTGTQTRRPSVGSCISSPIFVSFSHREITYKTRGVSSVKISAQSSGVTGSSSLFSGSFESPMSLVMG